MGLNMITIPVYLTSCFPGSMGGPAGTLNQLFITIGILFGYLMGLTVVDSSPEGFSWRFLIALPIFPALIRIFTTKNVFPYETVEMMIETEDDDMLQKYIHHIWEEVTPLDSNDKRRRSKMRQSARLVRSDKAHYDNVSPFSFLSGLEYKNKRGNDFAKMQADGITASRLLILQGGLGPLQPYKAH